MATVADCLRRAVELREVSDTPRLDVELLLTSVLDRGRVFLMTWPEHELTAAQSQHFDSALARRQRGEPIAHIIGYREFWSLPLQVNASTLIPRPDTELLVETALALLPPQRQKVLDLGTGTGAVALALASERPDWEVTATDKSADAVRLAEQNRERLQLANVRLIQSDWFADISPVDFDLIISNPPYIDPTDEHLKQGDLRFEPHSALVAEDQGLSDIRHIAEQAPRYNQRPFDLLLEHGWQQGEQVREILMGAGYEEITTVRDLAGHERATGGKYRTRAES